MEMRDEYKISVEDPEGMICFEERSLYGMILLKLVLQRGAHGELIPDKLLCTW
jgi:hypothetical protein